MGLVFEGSQTCGIAFHHRNAFAVRCEYQNLPFFFRRRHRKVIKEFARLSTHPATHLFHRIDGKCVAKQVLKRLCCRIERLLDAEKHGEFLKQRRPAIRLNSQSIVDRAKCNRSVRVLAHSIHVCLKLMLAKHCAKLASCRFFAAMSCMSVSGGHGFTEITVSLTGKKQIHSHSSDAQQLIQKPAFEVSQSAPFGRRLAYKVFHLSRSFHQRFRLVPVVRVCDAHAVALP